MAKAFPIGYFAIGFIFFGAAFSLEVAKRQRRNRRWMSMPTFLMCLETITAWPLIIIAVLLRFAVLAIRKIRNLCRPRSN